MLWSGVYAVGRETLRAGGKILADRADTEVKPHHIIEKHVDEAAQYLVHKLR